MTHPAGAIAPTGTWSLAVLDTTTNTALHRGGMRGIDPVTNELVKSAEAHQSVARGMSPHKAWQEPNGVLPSLVGAWCFTRSINDGTSMIGTAWFAHHGNNGIDYHERGQVRLADGRSLDAERCYVFEEMEDGFAVLFAESPPRLFHRITLRPEGSSLVGAGIHLCAADWYDSRYEFRSDGSFVVEHAVRGPRKQYVITTQYSREVAA